MNSIILRERKINFNIDNYVDKLFFAEEIGIKNIPIDLKKIAIDIFDIQIIDVDVNNELNNKSLFLTDKNKSYILCNKGLSLDDSNLILAEELAKYIYSAGNMHNNNSTCPIYKTKIEKLKRALLMPKYLVNQLKNKGLNKKEIIRKFKLQNYESIANKRFIDLDELHNVKKAIKKERRYKRLKKNKNLFYKIISNLNPNIDKTIEFNFFRRVLEVYYNNFELVTNKVKKI